jgi:preprotein translocase subunit YajC
VTLLLAQILAVDSGVAEDGGGGSGIFSFVLIIALLGGFFYFLIIRPQRNQVRKREALVSSLDIGDEVHTTGGIFGVIRRLDEDTAVLEVEDGGLLKVVRRAIALKVEPQD